MSGLNRAKKLEGRLKRKRHVQGTRSYLHAVVNSIARRSKGTTARRRKRR